MVQYLGCAMWSECDGLWSLMYIFNIILQLAELELTCQRLVLSLQLSALKAKAMYSSSVHLFQ